MDTQLTGKEGYIKAIPAFLSALHSEESSEIMDALRCLVGGAENGITFQALLEVKAICQITQSISAQDSTQGKPQASSSVHGLKEEQDENTLRSMHKCSRYNGAY